MLVIHPNEDVDRGISGMFAARGPNCSPRFANPDAADEPIRNNEARVVHRRFL